VSGEDHDPGKVQKGEGGRKMLSSGKKLKKERFSIKVISGYCRAGQTGGKREGRPRNSRQDLKMEEPSYH